jgi:hypothetical protein
MASRASNNSVERDARQAGFPPLRSGAPHVKRWVSQFTAALD